jgi:cold shock CspA family protein
MAIAILKSFNRNPGFAILKLDGQTAELAAHVMGRDRAVLSAVVSGQRIRFDLERDSPRKNLCGRCETGATPRLIWIIAERQALL